MSGPVDPSAGRAAKANQVPFEEYEAACPTTMTSWAIWTVPSSEGDGETSTGGVAIGLAEPDGGALAGGVGVGVGTVEGVTNGDADGDADAEASDDVGVGDAVGSGWSLRTETFVWSPALAEK